MDAHWRASYAVIRRTAYGVLLQNTPEYGKRTQGKAFNKRTVHGFQHLLKMGRVDLYLRARWADFRPDFDIF